MSFLIAEIVGLLLLAALCGAALAYWWLRRGFEDVTLEFQSLQGGANAVPALGDTRALELRFDALERAIAALGAQRAQPSEGALAAPATIALGPLEKSIAAAPAAIDLGPIEKSIAAIERQLSSIVPIPVDLEIIVSRIGGLERKINVLTSAPSQGAPADPERITERLAALEKSLSSTGPIPVDLEIVVSRIGGLERKIDAMVPQSTSGETDLGAKIAALSATVAGLAGRADSPAQQSSPVDLSGISASIAALSATTAALKSPAAIDLGPLTERIAALEQKCAALQIPSLTRVESSIDALSAAFDARLSALDARLQPAPVVVVAPKPVAPEPVAPEPVAPKPVATPAQKSMDSVRVTEGRNLLSKAAFGAPDDIEIIKGIGPKLREMLHKIGVFYFWQIAAWTDNDIAYVDDLLEAFQGRIERDEWVTQAIELAKGPTAAKPPQ